MRPSTPWSWRPTSTGCPPGPSTSWSRPSGSAAGISRSEVSRICAGLDEMVESFRERRLDHVGFPYVYLDATYLHVREHHQVTSKAVVIATGVAGHGHREILGIDVGDSENEVFWREFLRKLRARGLDGCASSSSPTSTPAWWPAIERCFQGAAHQRCRVHFARNLMATSPKGHQEMVSAAFKTVFAQVSGDRHARPVGPGDVSTWRAGSRRARPSWSRPRRRSWPLAPSRASTGVRSGRPIRSSGSTRR